MQYIKDSYHCCGNSIYSIYNHTQVVDLKKKIKKNGNTNVKSLNRAMGHHVRLVQPLCTVASSPPASGILQEGCGTILS